MSSQSILQIKDLTVSYHSKVALKPTNLSVPEHSVTALIGPSGCGKSTLLRCLNRMNDLVANATIKGSILFHNEEINDDSIDLTKLRKKIGMVFQKPNPFPKSIRENILWALKIHNMHADDKILESILRSAFLWDEVKDDLDRNALSLSGGQQQRLCIARAIALKPEIILMDEPCSALDPIATQKIEELISTLRKEFTVIIVTHNLAQAQRISDYTAFLYMGDLIEFGQTKQVFEVSKHQRTADYIQGRFG